MSAVRDDADVPDDVPTADYLEQHTVVDPDAEPPEDDEMSASSVDTSGVESEQVDTDVEADEADVLEQATPVPPQDEELERGE
jgi:hypothetical protein